MPVPPPPGGFLVDGRVQPPTQPCPPGSAPHTPHCPRQLQPGSCPPPALHPSNRQRLGALGHGTPPQGPREGVSRGTKAPRGLDTLAAVDQQPRAAQGSAGWRAAQRRGRWRSGRAAERGGCGRQARGAAIGREGACRSGRGWRRRQGGGCRRRDAGEQAREGVPGAGQRRRKGCEGGEGGAILASNGSSGRAARGTRAPPRAAPARGGMQCHRPRLSPSLSPWEPQVSPVHTHLPCGGRAHLWSHGPKLCSLGQGASPAGDRVGSSGLHPGQPLSRCMHPWPSTTPCYHRPPVPAWQPLETHSSSWPSPGAVPSGQVSRPNPQSYPPVPGEFDLAPGPAEVRVTCFARPLSSQYQMWGTLVHWIASASCASSLQRGPWLRG